MRQCQALIAVILQQAQIEGLRRTSPKEHFTMQGKDVRIRSES